MLRIDRCVCTHIRERSRVYRYMQRCAEARSFICICTQTSLRCATNIYLCAQIDLHAHTHSQTHMFTNFHVDTPHRYTGTSSHNTWKSPHTQGHTHNAHTRKGALQEGAVQGSLASHLEKLSAAPPVSGQLWAIVSACMSGKDLKGSCMTMDKLLSSLGLSFLIWKQK